MNIDLQVLQMELGALHLQIIALQSAHKAEVDALKARIAELEKPPST